MDDVLNKLGEFGVVPVVTIERSEEAIQLMKALMLAGLPCLEITFQTEAEEEAIRTIASKLPGVIVGAGAVISVEQAERAVNAGAYFVASPGFDPEIVDWCLGRGIPVTPGVATPTEINMALSKGLDILKFFPAEALGGVRTLKAISALYPHVKFIPTGGITQYNFANYMVLPMVHACGGSWLVDKRFISKGQFSEVTRLAQMALATVRQVRIR